MAKQLQIRRGTTAENDAFTGALAELTYDTTAKLVRIHDGTTVGGILIGQALPAGTRLLFQQTSAPLGWTKDTSATLNNSALRVTTGVVSDGGVTGFTTVFGAGKVSGAHVLTVAQMPNHAHPLPVSQDSPVFSGVATGPLTVLTSSGISFNVFTGGGGSHTHTLGLDVKFRDVIVAQKD